MAVQPGFAYDPTGTFSGISGDLGGAYSAPPTYSGISGDLGGVYPDLSIYFGTLNSEGEAVTGLGFQDGAYIMRAFKTTPSTGYVYWISREVPDLTGEQSGYPPIALTDIIILRNPCQVDPRDLP